MSSSTFYCNEKMLLDNWKYYGESNMLLKNLLKRTALSPTDCASFYFENMRNPESVSYDRSQLVRTFSYGRENLPALLDTHQVVLYKKDLDYITEARKRFHISFVQLQVLLGVIFFCRLYSTPNFSLETIFKLHKFTGCFKGKTKTVYCNGDTWDNGYSTALGLKEISDDYHLLIRIPTENIGCIYKYPNYSLNNNDIAAYTFNVTLENNKLDLNSIANELFDIQENYCVLCGSSYKMIKANRGLYCRECAIKKEKERIAKKDAARQMLKRKKQIY